MADMLLLRKLFGKGVEYFLTPLANIHLFLCNYAWERSANGKRIQRLAGITDDVVTS